MALTLATGTAAEPSRASVSAPAVAKVAGMASIGAGLVHSAVVGTHGEHDGAVAAFVLVALFQVGWGAIFAQRPARQWAVVGILGNLACAVSYVIACASGLPFIEGLDEAEDPGFPGVVAAALALTAVVGAALAALASRARPDHQDHPERTGPAVRSGRVLVPLAGLAVAALVGPAVAAGATDEHGHGATETHGHDAAVTPSTASPTGASGPVTTHGHATGDAVSTGNGDAVPITLAKPYDPSLPIDLSGTPGVTPQQQAQAEMLLTLTLARLPQWADTETAYAAGFRSIGDGLTGTEHYVNWAWINDDKILDPDYPESLVYDVKPDGTRVLSAAMFMLSSGQTLDDVPDVGGALMQWHIHDNLCYDTSGDGPRVVGLTNAAGDCIVGHKLGQPVPMIHVWIRPHECGPFAALEGVGAGQIKAGETRLCDHAHGAA